MEAIQNIPTKAGQICKIVNPLPDEDPQEVYIVSEDPSGFDDDEDIYVTGLKDLQKNISSPAFTPKFAVPKGDLCVIAEDLEAFIAAWNHQS